MDFRTLEKSTKIRKGWTVFLKFWKGMNEKVEENIMRRFLKGTNICGSAKSACSSTSEVEIYQRLLLILMNYSCEEIL